MEQNKLSPLTENEKSYISKCPEYIRALRTNDPFDIYKLKRFEQFYNKEIVDNWTDKIVEKIDSFLKTAGAPDKIVVMLELENQIFAPFVIDLYFTDESLFDSMFVLTPPPNNAMCLGLLQVMCNPHEWSINENTISKIRHEVSHAFNLYITVKDMIGE